MDEARGSSSGSSGSRRFARRRRRRRRGAARRGARLAPRGRAPGSRRSTSGAGRDDRPAGEAAEAAPRSAARASDAEEVIAERGSPIIARAVPRYGPPDALETPRYSGVRTFMRLPHVRDLDGRRRRGRRDPDGRRRRLSERCALRAGGDPQCVGLLRQLQPTSCDVVERLSIVDWGDAPTVPGFDRGVARADATAVEEIARAGVVTLCLGGDHTVLLAELRALAAVHGTSRAGSARRAPRPVGRVLRSEDLPREHRAAGRRGGSDRPARSIQAGMRGSLYGAGRLAMPANSASTGSPTRSWPRSGRPGSRSVSATRRDAPCFLSFDIDFVDPAFAPGTGTPEVGGPSSREALTYLRSLAGLDFRGFDCVEVWPPFDPAGVTALVAANACFEMLSLLALRR